MKKIIVSIIVIGILLTTSMISVNAFAIVEKQKNSQIGFSVPNLDNPVEYWGLCISAILRR